MDPRLWIGAGAAGLGAILLAALALTSRRSLPRDRRRWGEASESPLTIVANALTAAMERMLRGRSFKLADTLARAGVRQTPQDFVVLVLVLAVVLFSVVGLLTNMGLGLLAAAGSAPTAWLVLKIMIDRRQKAFGRQLDEILQILAGSLRAGYSLPQGIATVANELEEPAASEFTRVINEARVGRPLVGALDEASVRLANPDFRWVVQAIAINREVGGNLADVLDAVGDTIRERLHLSRQVEALAADGKFSGIILTLLPVAVALLLSFANPTYMSKLFTHPLGNVMIAVGLVLLLIGALWMRVLVKIKF